MFLEFEFGQIIRQTHFKKPKNYKTKKIIHRVTEIIMTPHKAKGHDFAIWVEGI